MPTPTIAVKESLDDLKGIGPSTGISGFKLVYVVGKGLYQYQTGDQSSQNFSTDTWVAPSEDTSGKSGAWNRIERTGHDANVVSGTAGTNGNLSEWNADGDLVDSSVAGSDVLVKPSTSSDPSLAFDTWRTPNADQLTLVQVSVRAETDGTSPGNIKYLVDESGGTTQDYANELAFVEASLPNGTRHLSTTTITIPAGASYQVSNDGDPNGSNAIDLIREFTL